MARDDEKLDKPNFIKVINLLEADKPITKKAACEILNITYNTTRLGKLIENFKVTEKKNKERRAKLRGKPLTEQELAMIAESYLADGSLSSISENLYRPVSLIKKAISNLNIPLRDSDATYQHPHFIEDHAVTEEYEKDDLVYAAKYGSAALIEKRIDYEDGPAYIIYVLGNSQCYATQPYYELADLRKLQKELKILMKPQTGMLPSYNPKV